jgi:hypothetical protein
MSALVELKRPKFKPTPIKRKSEPVYSDMSTVSKNKLSRVSPQGLVWKPSLQYVVHGVPIDTDEQRMINRLPAEGMTVDARNREFHAHPDEFTYGSPYYKEEEIDDYYKKKVCGECYLPMITCFDCKICNQCKKYYHKECAVKCVTCKGPLQKCLVNKKIVQFIYELKEDEKPKKSGFENILYDTSCFMSGGTRRRRRRRGRKTRSYHR